MRKTGFTLIELLIVVAIIAILAAIAVPNFLEAQVRAKAARVHADMRTIATAIEAYTVDWNTPPEGRVGQIPEMTAPSFKRWCWPIYWYCPGGGVHPQGSHGVLSLTTPVAYMQAHMVDPFVADNALQKGTDENYYQLPVAQNVSYFYVNFSGAYKRVESGLGFTGFKRPQDWPTGGMYPARFNGSGGEETMISWLLLSPGPDGIAKDAASLDSHNNDAGATIVDPYDPAQFLLRPNTANVIRYGGIDTYDATNGSRSDGQIVRTSGGIPGK